MTLLCVSEPSPKTFSCGVQEHRAMIALPPQRSRAVSNLLFFRRSLAYRSAAVEMMRNARAMPFGSERHAARQLARALRDLAKTEAWLEGQTPRLGPMADDRERASPRFSRLADFAPQGNPDHFSASLERDR
jgi:hypothetical protein